MQHDANNTDHNMGTERRPLGSQLYLHIAWKMSSDREVIPDNRKPIVGIIYSDGDSNSVESKSLAFYLASSLAFTGYAKVNLVALRPDGSPSDLDLQQKDLHKGSISFLPPGKSSVNDVKNVPVCVNTGTIDSNPNNTNSNAPPIRLSHWNELQYCQMIIVTVNSNDSDSCCAKIATVLPSSLYRVVVFSLQRGVKNGGILKDGLKGIITSAPKSKNTPKKSSNGEKTTTDDVAVVEGFIGFACVPVSFFNSTPTDPKNPEVPRGPKGSKILNSFCYYASTIISPKMMIERLNKEISAVADGPVNLLETLGIEIQFRKTLTPYAWGVLLFENLHALNSVTGGDLLATIRCRRFRLLLALMIRESRETLLKAARGGKWAPDLNLIAPYITPWMLEMMLVIPLPSMFFNIFWFFINFIGGFFSPWGMISSTGVRSPGQVDLLAGRNTMADYHLGEIVIAGERNKIDTPICSAVLSTIRTLESTVLPVGAVNNQSTGVIREETYSNVNEVKGRMAVIDAAYTAVTGNTWYKHPSLWEVSYRSGQIGAVMCFIVMILVVIYEGVE